MKRILLLLITLQSSLIILFSQAPQGFNYQAIVRDDAGTVVSNQIVGIKISILQESVSGTVIYSETHAPTTNAFGLVTMEIGGGTTSDDFSAIDWGADLYFLKVEMDASGGTSYSEMGTTQLLSVPYALFAENATDKDDADADPANEIQDLAVSDDLLTITGNPGATDIDLSVYLDNTDSWVQNGDAIFFNGDIGIGTDTPGGKLEVVGDGSETPDDPLFEVKRNDGQTVFAVYPEGVRIYVDDSGTKGTKGGFAIGGFNPATKGLTNEFLRVTPDSVRVYVNDDGTKGTKGGFAVGGYSPLTKGITNDYLRVSPDSVRIYIDDDLVKGTKGGFAIGGFRPAKGPGFEYLKVTKDSTRVYLIDSLSTGFGIANIQGGNYDNLMDLTTQNYFVGHKSGISNSTGYYNSFIGFESGTNNTTGLRNIFIGYKSGYSNIGGSYNVFIGNESGKNNTTNGNYNSFLGYQSGFSNTTGNYNVFLGCWSGYSNLTGRYNVFLGSEAGRHNTTGQNNTIIGDRSGAFNSTGNDNVFIGRSTGNASYTGNFNVFVGNGSGWNNDDGNNNAFLGYYSGVHNAGDGNVGIGYRSGYWQTEGNNNVFIGNSAGHGLSSSYNATGNICIGNQAGYYETGSNRLYIENSNATASNALIYGEFDNNRLTFNANVGIGTITPGGQLHLKGTSDILVLLEADSNNSGEDDNPRLELSQDGGLVIGGFGYVGSTDQIYSGSTGNALYMVNGYNSDLQLGTNNTACMTIKSNGRVGIGTNAPGTVLSVVGLTGTASGTTLRIYNNNVYYTSSSRKNKKDISPLSDDFTKILKANPVSFTDIASGERNIGYIAEDFDELGLQNLVVYRDGEPISLRYELVSLYNLEVIKEQQKIIEKQQTEIDELKRMVKEVMGRSRD